MALLKRLTDEWEILMAEHHEETLKTYNETVAKENKETFEEFKESLKIEWLAERVKKIKSLYR